MVDPAAAVLVVLLVAAFYCFLGFTLWRIMRAVEAIARHLGNMETRLAQTQEPAAKPPSDAEKPPVHPLPRRSPNLDRIRKELEERRKVSEEEESE